MTSQNQESVALELETFVRQRFCVDIGDAPNLRSVNLWEEGYVDSTGVVEMIAFIESRFDFQLPDEVIFDPGFATIEGMANCVVRLSNGNAA